MTCPDCRDGRTYTDRGYVTHRRLAHGPDGDGDGGHRVRLPFSVPESLATAIEDRAASDGISVAEFGRRAMAAYLERAR